MGGFQSRLSSSKEAPSVADILQNPGLTVEKACTTEKVTAILKERFEALVGSSFEAGDEQPTPKRSKKAFASEEAASSSSRSHLCGSNLPSLNSKLPPNTEVVDVHLLASGVPITRESVDALVALGVRTFVSFTVMPLSAPRAMHVNLADLNNPGFMDRDPDMLDGLFSKHNCTAIHMPCNDAGTLATKQVDELVKVCRSARQKNEAVLLHCWAGSRRTWAAARIVKRVLDNISAGDIASAVRGKKSQSNQAVDEFLSSPNFPAAPSSTAERLQLLALAAALQAVTGGGGLYSTRIEKEGRSEAASMFCTYWPSTTRRLDDRVDGTTLEKAFSEIESTFGIPGSKSRDFPQELQRGWKSFADSVLLRACSDDQELASSITEELIKRGPKDVRDKVFEAMGGGGCMNDSF